ncbi:hypothetical protein BT69DRAFT_1229092 [Atractiella rhizophila]|nr:hypothetical protein BT69DRAFT_1229092 [Atractiella rhizophila]
MSVRISPFLYHLISRNRLHVQAITNLFKRNSVFVSTVAVTAFGFSIVFEKATTAFWDNHNRGKQWKDIRHKYVEAEE